jgi:hypothetical protein
MPAHSLYRYYHDFRAVVRNQVLLFFPRTWWPWSQDVVSMRRARKCPQLYWRTVPLTIAIANWRNWLLLSIGSSKKTLVLWVIGKDLPTW